MPTPLIHHYDVEGVLCLGQREHRPFQWPRVSLLTPGTLQIRIRFVRQRRNPTLEQTNNRVILHLSLRSLHEATLFTNENIT